MLIYRFSIFIKLVLAMSIASFPALSQVQVQGRADALLPPSSTINSALDAASILALSLDSNMGGVSSSSLIVALEDAAKAGEPIAMWRLGVMYENGDGIEKDMVKAFGYFSRLANDYAYTPRQSLQADIVAQAFVKLGAYYRDGMPEAGVRQNSRTFHTLLMHAASYFGDADAQYRVGKLYLDENEMGRNPLQSARWLSLAAKKGHVGAQARLGELLFNGEGVTPQPVEGLMWLQVARENALGTEDERWIAELYDFVQAQASQEQMSAALLAVNSIGDTISGN